MTDKAAAQALTAAISSLRTEILPLLKDDAARIRVDHITRLLNWVAARESVREDGLRQLLDSARVITTLPRIETTKPSREDLEQHRKKIDQEICERIPELLAAAAEGPEGIQALEQIIDLEKAFYLSQDPDIAAGSQVVYRGGRIDQAAAPRQTDWSPIDETTLTAYLRRRFGRSDVNAADVRAIPGGFSKQTLFFSLHDEANGSCTDLVMRKDMPFPFIDKTVTNEFPLLLHLHKLGFPVAEPLWLENDDAAFGGRFIVSKRVVGSSDAAKWAADPERARHACRRLAEILARLHSYSPTELGFPKELSELSAGVLMELEISNWTNLFHRKRLEPFPLQELPLTWLGKNIPKTLYARPARIVHGDFGFHNLMFDDHGEIRAVLDWEFSILGDTTQDICFVRQFVETIIGWEPFLQLYTASGGPPPCREAMFFFELWSKTRNSIGCVDSHFLFERYMPEEMKFALSGYVFAPYLFIDECETLLSHLKQSSA